MSFFKMIPIDINRLRRYTALEFGMARPLLKANTALNAHYIVRCASVLAWCYVGGHLPEQLVIDLL